MTVQRLLRVLASWMAIGTDFRDGSESWQLCPLTSAQARLLRAVLSPRALAKLRKRLAVAQPP